jgi:hypothetical protein
MSTIKLTDSEIGRFTNKEQLQTYIKMLSVKEPIDAMIQDIVTLDDDTTKSHPIYGRDYNFKMPGNVLIKNKHCQGNLEFNPETKEAKQMILTNSDPSGLNNYNKQYEFSETEDQKIYTHMERKRFNHHASDIEKETVAINKKTNEMELTSTRYSVEAEDWEWEVGYFPEK